MNIKFEEAHQQRTKKGETVDDEISPEVFEDDAMKNPVDKYRALRMEALIKILSIERRFHKKLTIEEAREFIGWVLSADRAYLRREVMAGREEEVIQMLKSQEYQIERERNYNENTYSRDYYLKNRDKIIERVKKYQERTGRRDKKK